MASARTNRAPRRNESSHLPEDLKPVAPASVCANSSTSVASSPASTVCLLISEEADPCGQPADFRLMAGLSASISLRHLVPIGGPDPALQGSRRGIVAAAGRAALHSRSSAHPATVALALSHPWLEKIEECRATFQQPGPASLGVPPVVPHLPLRGSHVSEPTMLPWTPVPLLRKWLDGHPLPGL